MRPAAWVFVDDLGDRDDGDDLDELALADADAHHLGRVLRLRPGEAVGASDGAGRWRPCRVAGAGRDLRLLPAGPVVAEPAPAPPICVGFSLVKGDRPELVVQKLTELGVDRILPLVADRSVVQWEGERAERHLARLRQVAREAAMQSRRCRLPEVGQLTTPAGAGGPGLATGLCQQGGNEPPSLHLPTLLVGPEGGWSEQERSLGLRSVALGPTTLRAETAAIVAGTLLCALRSATVREGRSSITRPA